ncbi:MAG: carbohydrate ABC transporter substrate-binding protein [Clostridia bacterium]|nr:carbohydrate ABC transporter substrate-binding protein [Clostridia bacterium]
MKIYAAGIMAALMVLLVSCAAAQEAMRLYVGEGAMEEGHVRQLMALLEEDAQWTLMEDERTLRELVLAGDAPDLAICAPAEAQPWAREGLLLPLHTHIGSQQRMQRQVLDLCVHREELFMAPLVARHRQMAVNVRMLEELGLGYMLDSQTYPVWYPAQFYQIMEEFLIKDEIAVDVWRAQMDDSAAIEALTQAVFGGMLLSEDGLSCTANSMNMRAGVQWLSDCIDDGMIGYCQTREDALARFLSGETAIFIDWTQALQAQLEETIREKGLEIETRPYPAAVGLPVRSFELVGVCAFASGEQARDAKLVRACVKMHEAAQEVLGARGVWQDGAIWPASLDGPGGATLRSLFCEALTQMIEGGQSAQDALERVQAAMDALGQTK